MRQSRAAKVNVILKRQFESSPRCQRLHLIDPSMPSSRFRKDTIDIACWQALMLIQMRTGHILLQKHLNRIGQVSSLTCPACCTADETVYHHLMVCPAYRDHRHTTWLRHPPMGPSVCHIARIHDSPPLASHRQYHFTLRRLKPML